MTNTSTKILQSSLLIHSSDITESNKFYTALGLSIVEHNKNTFSDGVCLIRPSLNLVNDLALELTPASPEELFQTYSDLGILFNYSAEASGELTCSMTDPNGFVVNFIDPKPLRLPPSPSRFDEVSLPTKLFTESVNFWVKLGYECFASRSTYPRTLMLNGPARVGLHDASHKAKKSLCFTIEATQLKILKEAGFPIMKQQQGTALTLSPEGLEVQLNIK